MNETLQRLGHKWVADVKVGDTLRISQALWRVTVAKAVWTPSRRYVNLTFTNGETHRLHQAGSVSYFKE